MTFLFGFYSCHQQLGWVDTASHVSARIASHNIEALSSHAVSKSSSTVLSVAHNNVADDPSAKVGR